MHARKFARYSSDIPVSFEIDDIMGEHLLYLKDASQGGLCLNAHGCIDCGTHVKIRIPLADEFYITDGKITWCQQLDTGQCLLGVTFAQLIRQSIIEKLAQLH